MRLYIIGLGNGTCDNITMQGLSAVRSAAAVYIQTREMPAVAFLADKGIELRDMDDLYAQAGDFDALNAAIADRLSEAVLKHADVAYLVYGGGYFGTHSGTEINAVRPVERFEHQRYARISYRFNIAKDRPAAQAAFLCERAGSCSPGLQQFKDCKESPKPFCNHD